MSIHIFLVFLHILGVTIWVGGMFFAYVCLRPAAAMLEPERRLRLLQSALGRFFHWVALIIVVVLVSGFAMMLHVGFADAPKGWHWMMTSGLLMMLIFGHIYGASYRRLRRAVSAADWATAGAAMNSIRHLVGVNLLLGVLTIAFATLGAVY